MMNATASADARVLIDRIRNLALSPQYRVLSREQIAVRDPILRVRGAVMALRPDRQWNVHDRFGRLLGIGATPELAQNLAARNARWLTRVPAPQAVHPALEGCRHEWRPGRSGADGGTWAIVDARGQELARAGDPQAAAELAVKERLGEFDPARLQERDFARICHVVDAVEVRNATGVTLAPRSERDKLVLDQVLDRGMRTVAHLSKADPEVRAHERQQMLAELAGNPSRHVRLANGEYVIVLREAGQARQLAFETPDQRIKRHEQAITGLHERLREDQRENQRERAEPSSGDQPAARPRMM